jgi:hypothetical protein
LILSACIFFFFFFSACPDFPRHTSEDHRLTWHNLREKLILLNPIETESYDVLLVCQATNLQFMRVSIPQGYNHLCGPTKPLVWSTPCVHRKPFKRLFPGGLNFAEFAKPEAKSPHKSRQVHLTWVPISTHHQAHPPSQCWNWNSIHTTLTLRLASRVHAKRTTTWWTCKKTENLLFPLSGRVKRRGCFAIQKRGLW